MAKAAYEERQTMPMSFHVWTRVELVQKIRNIRRGTEDSEHSLRIRYSRAHSMFVYSFPHRSPLNSACYHKAIKRAYFGWIGSRSRRSMKYTTSVVLFLALALCSVLTGSLRFTPSWLGFWPSREKKPKNGKTAQFLLPKRTKFASSSVGWEFPPTSTTMTNEATECDAMSHRAIRELCEKLSEILMSSRSPTHRFDVRQHVWDCLGNDVITTQLLCVG